jgi:hypothetical protein
MEAIHRRTLRRVVLTGALAGAPCAALSLAACYDFGSTTVPPAPAGEPIGSQADSATEPFTDTSREAGAPDAEGTCDGGILCDGVCVNPVADPKNCGACGNTCTTGVCGASIHADLRSQPTSWRFNGSAAYDKSTSSGVLTLANVPSRAGTLIYEHSAVVDEFDATFDFRIGFGGGGTRDDGMGFMFERAGATAVGPKGGALGMVGLDGYAMELDIFGNGVCGDANGNHVGIDSLAQCDLADLMPTSIYASPDLTGNIDLGDGAWHTAKVKLKGAAMSIAVDGTQIVTGQALTGFQPGGEYYFGFAGATGGWSAADGGGGYRSEVRNVTIAFPTPRCL